MTPDLPPVVDVDASLSAWVEQVCDAEHVDVDWTGLDASRLPQGTQSLRWTGDPCRRRPTLRATAVRRSEAVARYTVQPELTAWVRVPVAATDLQAGEALDVGSGLVASHAIIGQPVSDGVARVDIAAGDPLTTSVVALRMDAHTGSTVDLVVRRGALQISAPGRLLEGARRGDRVRVANAFTREGLLGILVDDTTVEVRR